MSFNRNIIIKIMISANLVVLFYAIGTIAIPVKETSWEAWKTKYNKVYDSNVEEIKRHNIFKDTVAFAKKHNAEYLQGKHTYYVDANKFADLTREEFVSIYTSQIKISPKTKLRKYSTKSLPASVDWVKKGYVTGVKNQEQCGSCWAFSTTGTLEGAYFKYSNETDLKSFSEQQLVDCSSQNYGCMGGYALRAYQYIEETGGIETESEYCYVAKQENCKANPLKFQGNVKTYYQVGQTELQLQAATAEEGPISVGIDASHASFHTYAGGVYYQPHCNATLLDHVVLVVGYGVYNGQDYWLVKNSWGADWGLQGYIMMSRNRDNNCGICSEASYPVACAPRT